MKITERAQSFLLRVAAARTERIKRNTPKDMAGAARRLVVSALFILIGTYFYSSNIMKKENSIVLLFGGILPSIFLDIIELPTSLKYVKVTGKSNVKKFNEQLKLLSSFIHAVAIALIIGAVAKPLIDNDINLFTFSRMMIVFISVLLHYWAIKILEAWHDEDAD